MGVNLSNKDDGSRIVCAKFILGSSNMYISVLGFLFIYFTHAILEKHQNCTRLNADSLQKQILLVAESEVMCSIVTVVPE